MSDGGGDMALRVNKKELAKLLGYQSTNAVDRLLERYPDFPIVERGSNGRDYVFDVENVKAWRAAQLEAERRAAAEREDLLGQSSLPGMSDAAEKGLSGSQQLNFIKAKREEHKLGLETGLLVSTAELRFELDRAFTRLAQRLDALPENLARRFRLSPEIVHAIREDLEAWRKEQVADLGELMRRDDEEAPRRAAAE